MEEVTDKIKVKNGIIAVGTGWFEEHDSSTISSVGDVDGENVDVNIRIINQICRKWGLAYKIFNL